MSRRLAPALALLLVSLSSPPARGEDGAGSLGRLSGDVGLSLEGGAELGAGARPAGQFRALYLATAGVYGTLAGGAGGPLGSFGVELRPLFLPRFLKDLERGPGALDLVIDSLFFGFGAHVRRGEQPGIELGTGLELPLVGGYEGLYLGGRLYHRLEAPRLSGDGSATSTVVLVTLGFRLTGMSHLVDAGDAVLR